MAPFLRIMSVSGLVVWGHVLWRHHPHLSWSEIGPKIGPKIGLAFVAVAIAVPSTLPMHYRFVAIGELNYMFGPVVEIFLADYLSPLRVPAAYPLEMTSAHILATTTAAAMGCLLPKVTMLQGIEIWFLLLTFAMARIAYHVLSRSGLALWQSVPLVLAVELVVFQREFDASARITTYVFWVLAVELGLIIYWQRQNIQTAARDILFVLVAIATAKLSVAYVPFLIFLWVATRFPRQMLHPTVLLSGIIAATLMVVTVIRPHLHAQASYKITLFNPLGGRASLDYYPNMMDSLLRPDTVAWFSNQDYSVGILLIAVLMALKYWLVPMKATEGLGRAHPEFREIYRCGDVAILVTLATWVLLRHDQHGTTHSSLPPLAMTGMIMAAVLARACLPSRAAHWRLGLILYAVVSLASGYQPWEKLRPASSDHLGGVSHAELEAMTEAEIMAARPGAPVTDICYRALLRGMRIAAGTVPRECLGTLGYVTAFPAEK
ncbi:hypothetical protein CU669_00230 [Paramagnetospirillum kuznetsovii]|uniref:Uncharacterized protein n=1 Tax=Paramagnetospirillum kuznetsovii TaxID=2053833 RepID=A0A364P2S7_9PROT|nr:hypothetical protein CU669_00230 [Paramagnetospirillum kuznetsovii]